MNKSSTQCAYIRLNDVHVWKLLKRNGVYLRPYESADIYFLLLRRILDAHMSRNISEVGLALSYFSALLDLLKNETTRQGG